MSLENFADKMSMWHRGLVLFSFGLFGAYFSFYRPVSDAFSHSKHLSTFFLGSMLTVFGVFLGSVLLLMGDRYIPYFGTHRTTTTLGKVLMGFILITGLLLHFLLRHYLEGLGYRFDSAL